MSRSNKEVMNWKERRTLKSAVGRTYRIHGTRQLLYRSPRSDVVWSLAGGCHSIIFELACDSMLKYSPTDIALSMESLARCSRVALSRKRAEVNKEYGTSTQVEDKVVGALELVPLIPLRISHDWEPLIFVGHQYSRQICLESQISLARSVPKQRLQSNRPSSEFACHPLCR